MLTLKVKLQDLKFYDALLKRLAMDLNPNKQPQTLPQLVILLNGQLVAGDFYPKYEKGCPFTNELNKTFNDYLFSADKIPTQINYHIVQRFHLRQFKSKEESIEFLFNNPDILFLMLKDQPLNHDFEEGQPFIYNPRLLWQETLKIKFLTLDKDTCYELVSLDIQHL